MKLLHVAFFLLLFDVVAVFSQTIKIENIGTKMSESISCDTLDKC